MADSCRYLAQLSTCSAERLNVHPLFNAPQSDAAPTTSKADPPLQAAANTLRFRFETTDPDDLYQTQLITPSTTEDPIQGHKVIGCKQLNDEHATIEFTVSELTVASGTFVGLQVLDTHGNVTLHWYRNEGAPSVSMDVNEDGVVNILDLVFVASQFGVPKAPHRADVNKDGTVNIQDLVLVANGLNK